MTDTDDGAGRLRDQYRAITELVSGLDERAMLGPTRCTGWTVQDLLFHVLLDAQRALVTFATPTADEPDRDLVSYWTAFDPANAGDDELDHALFVRRAAAAYGRPGALVTHWRHLSCAAARAAAACPHRRVATQGHVLTVPDFVATLVTEAAVHHHDLTVGLPAAARPSRSSAARSTACSAPRRRNTGTTWRTRSRAPAGCRSTTPAASRLATRPGGSRCSARARYESRESAAAHDER